MSGPLCRAHYAPALRDFLSMLDAEGLSDTVRSGLAADWSQVSKLAGLGLISSSTIRDGERTWRLRFTRVAREVRKLLLAEAARR